MKLVVDLVIVFFLLAPGFVFAQDHEAFDRAAEDTEYGEMLFQRAVVTGNALDRRSAEGFIAWNNAMRDRNWQEALKHMREDYIQHNPNFPTGAEGFVDSLRNSDFTLNMYRGVVRVIVDGNWIAIHRAVSRPDEDGERNRLVMVDLFRMDHFGRLAEHWVLFQSVPDETANGRQMWEDAEEFADLVSSTEVAESAAKEMVADYYNLAFNERNIQLAADRYLGVYAQHNPRVEDGPQGFVKFLSGFPPRDPNRPPGVPLVLVSQNDLVGLFQIGGGGTMGIFDFYRVRDDKIQEHWDVIMQVPNMENAEHDNGFF